MIFTLNDLLDDLCKEFPELSKGSIRKICTIGINKIKQKLRGFTNFVVTFGDLRKAIFFRPRTPERHNALVYYRANKKENEGRNS